MTLPELSELSADLTVVWRESVLEVTVNLLICDRAGALYSVQATVYCISVSTEIRPPPPQKKIIYNCKYDVTNAFL